jgi:predicted transcriptional regulator
VAQSKKRSIASVEKQILLAAKEENGIVTPALVALKTELSIQEAEKMLDDMAQNGYTVMQVRESGRIEYEFPEFMPRLGNGAGESI